MVFFYNFFSKIMIPCYNYIVVIVMKKVIFSLLIIIGIVFLGGCSKETDALKFKEEYESLNGTSIENSNYKYPSIEIINDNAVKYSTNEEILKVLENGTGVIYFGYPTCPWCRNAVPVLLEAANEVGIENIYYLNMKDERDQIKVKEDGTLEVVNEGTEGYKKLLERLDNILTEYTLEDVHGNTISANEKRIYVPLAVFVREGEIVGYHVDTVETQTNPFELLNEEQKNELMDIYINLMHKVLNDVCDSEC